MKDLSDLRIYRLAVEVAEEVRQEVSGWDKFCKWSLGKQLVDSAAGIAAIMIEGSQFCQRSLTLVVAGKAAQTHLKR